MGEKKGQWYKEKNTIVLLAIFVALVITGLLFLRRGVRYEESDFLFRRSTTLYRGFTDEILMKNGDDVASFSYTLEGENYTATLVWGNYDYMDRREFSITFQDGSVVRGLWSKEKKEISTTGPGINGFHIDSTNADESRIEISEDICRAFCMIASKTTEHQGSIGAFLLGVILYLWGVWRIKTPNQEVSVFIKWKYKGEVELSEAGASAARMGGVYRLFLGGFFILNGALLFSLF